MQVIIDHTEDIVLDTEVFGNEFATLNTLRHGLFFLAARVHDAEKQFEDKTSSAMHFIAFGARTEAELQTQQLVTCLFHWFAVTVCNYARLIGFIRAITTGGFTRRDLHETNRKKLVSAAVRAYVDNVPELVQVIKWRNKIAGHFAITDPFPDDNIATLDMSVIHPLSVVDGLYRVGEFTLFKKNSDGEHTSQLPAWSLSEAFDDLIPRYWPQLLSKPDSGSEKPVDTTGIREV